MCRAPPSPWASPCFTTTAPSSSSWIGGNSRRAWRTISAIRCRSTRPRVSPPRSIAWARPRPGCWSIRPRAPSWVFDRLTAAGAAIVERDDPCLLPKARKNEAELEGTRSAHRRDGAAVTRLPRTGWPRPRPRARSTSSPPSTGWRASAGRAISSAISASTRSPAPGRTAPSSITGRASATNRPLKSGELYLVDSGAQYVDGTTDITRTVAIGPPTAETKDRFTRVLKGHIALGPGALPQGHHRQPARCPGPLFPLAGGARLRPRHRPWRRQLPLGA